MKTHQSTRRRWEHIEPDGSNLTVEDFLSVPIVRIAAHLKRFPSTYAGQADLTLPQWRLLSVVAHHRSIALKQLAEVSASDKAMVSRTVKELIQRELVYTTSMNAGDRSLVCKITPKGARMVGEIIPKACAKHAELLLTLTPRDRVRLYDILQKLQGVCAEMD
ncbi:MAG TPA: MarR family winged helix-turn-helix transcriptional regulator [Eoetvoesiella sp.]|uniref:MarR family winged helix-turn-helix transcriptional regulator n=1 Tax=Eoetvoesiella sp. TaxID=1966355 RepID=UPI002C509ADB|nr:MarR family winged helix-turn-helix transcriptional regulator [Eoetvoesiella sp.]HWK59980.1 MarR family winged helix-turn-helix transcriptional regulator [Eoetvoesiella sp.]